MTTQLSPLRTLIVDDSQDECVLLCAELRSSDTLKVIGFVHDGVEALAYIQGTDQFKKREIFPYPDLLLLDFQMPHCDGIGLLRKLKHQLFRPRVILWSSTLEQVDVPLALRLGADLVCQKPFGRSELLEVVERIRANLFGWKFAGFGGELAEPVHAAV
jgi:two-component system, response regulator